MKNNGALFLTNQLIDQLEKVNDFFKVIMPDEHMVVMFGGKELRFINPDDLVEGWRNEK